MVGKASLAAWLSAVAIPVAIAVAILGVAGCKSERPSHLLELARATTHKGELSHAIPIFSVRSLRASQAYYRDVLGFKVEWEDGDPPDFGAVSRDEAVLFMCQGCQGNPGTWVMVFAENVDRLHRQFTAKKARVLKPPTDMPWKLREMHVADPDGNVIRFAGRMEH
jgi:catechol 2,3-dioxygenase-like lactoylglutathione lyase family enzyme